MSEKISLDSSVDVAFVWLGGIMLWLWYWFGVQPSYMG